MLSLRTHHYLVGAGIFLVTVALIAGLVGCDGVEYDLTITSTAGGSVTTPGEGTFTYDEGTVVDLIAKPDEGYYFVNWTGDVGTVDDVNDATTAITMTGDCSITANFVAIYDLTVASTEGGSVNIPGEGTFVYAANTMVDLVAEPHEHYHFVEWTGDVYAITDVESAATNITMYGDYSITANFELDPGWYSLTIFNNYGGSVTEPGEGTFVYAANTTVNLVAQPNEDYQFLKWTGDVDTIANVNDATTTITMDNNYSITANFRWYNITQVNAGTHHTVGLKSDGTVVAVGYNHEGQCNVGDWTNITQVDTRSYHTVGLKTDGTVVTVGYKNYWEYNVGGWTNITQVAAGGWYTVGLKNDGTVVAVGDNDDGQCDVGDWTDITQVAAGIDHTVGLKSDGTVVAVGDNHDGQCNVSGWTNITQVAAGNDHTVGLKTDGTVVAVGFDDYGQCNVGGWTGIVQVAAGSYHTVGLKTDGTVVAAGTNVFGKCDVGGWTDIVQVAAGWGHTVGLKTDGTVVAVGYNDYGECNVGG
jgi:alpha-tubulin suppressor-like RCC1 family protein